LKEEAMRRTILTVALGLVVIAGGRVDAHPPWGIVVDPQGRVVFADIDHGNHIWRIDGTGKLTSLIEGRHSHDLHLAPDGTLFLATVTYIKRGERFESRLVKLPPGGEPTVVVDATTDRKEFWGNAFAVDPEGNVYFGYTNNPRAGEAEDESLLRKRSPDGRVVTLAGSTKGHRDGTGAAAKFRGFNDLAWGPSGVLYVSDGSSIRMVTRDGAVTTLARDLVAKPGGSPPSGGAGSLFGLAVGPDGAAYAADHSGRRVVKLTADGQASVAATTEPPWAPTGVAVAGADLYLLEVGSSPARVNFGPRVRKVTPSGKSEILATVPE
jgi:sugar lactone lactonase YvrE